jgi:alpha-1,2-mannosyltransferase
LRKAASGLLRLPSLRAALLLFSVSALAALASILLTGASFIDLRVYRDAGSAVLDGARLYDILLDGHWFTYPPAAAIAFVAIAPVPMAAAKVLMSLVSLALLPLTLRWALRLLPADRRLPPAEAIRLALVAAALAVWLEPVFTTLRYGQVDVVIAALVLFDLSRHDAHRSKGVPIGLAAGLKLTPAIFAVYLLLTRRVRAAATSAVTFAATVALGFAVIPHDATDFWTGAIADPDRVGRIHNAANQSLRGASSRLLHTTDVGAWWIVTGLLVGAVGMALAVRAGRRGDDALGFSLCALTGLLVSPISWSHHWVIVIPALLLLLVEAHRRRWTAGLVAGAATAAAAGYLYFIWWVPIGGTAELHLSGLQLVWADVYVALGLGALAAAGWRAATPAAAQRLRGPPP